MNPVNRTELKDKISRGVRQASPDQHCVSVIEDNLDLILDIISEQAAMVPIEDLQVCADFRVALQRFIRIPTRDDGRILNGSA